MKRMLCLLLILILGIGICACRKTIPPITEPTDAKLKTAAVNALQKKLDTEYGDICDMSKTEISVNTVKHGYLNPRVEGTYTLYDMHGKQIKSNDFSITVMYLYDQKQYLTVIEKS